MSDGERGGVEATAREIVVRALEAFARDDYWEPITVRDDGEAHQVWAWNDYRVPYEVAATALAALRAASPTLEHSRLEGNAIGQPTSVVTHDSEGRGMMTPETAAFRRGHGIGLLIGGMLGSAIAIVFAAVHLAPVACP